MKAPPLACSGLLALLVIAGGCRREASTAEPPAAPAAPAVPVAAAVPGAAPVTAAEPAGFLGVILPRQTIDVSAQAGGRIAAILVRPGDEVRLGQPLARLDPEALRHDLERSAAALRLAQSDESRAALDLADAESRQRRRLAIPESFSKEDLASAEIQRQAAIAALEGARARRAGAEAEVRLARTALGELDLKAPFAGTVALRYLDAGATVGSGTPVLRLVSSRERIVRFAAPPEEARRLQPGTAIRATVAAGAAGITGTIERIAPEVDAASQMIFVEARVERQAADPTEARSIEPGTPVRVQLVAPSGAPS